AGQHLAGGFGFERNGSEVGVALEISDFTLTAGDKTIVSLSGQADMLFTETGFAGQFGFGIGHFGLIKDLEFGGAVTFYINTTGKSVDNIAGFGVDLGLKHEGDIITRIKIRT